MLGVRANLYTPALVAMPFVAKTNCVSEDTSDSEDGKVNIRDEQDNIMTKSVKTSFDSENKDIMMFDCFPFENINDKIQFMRICKFNTLFSID